MYCWHTTSLTLMNWHRCIRGACNVSNSEFPNLRLTISSEIVFLKEKMHLLSHHIPHSPNDIGAYVTCNVSNSDCFWWSSVGLVVCVRDGVHVCVCANWVWQTKCVWKLLPYAEIVPEIIMRKFVSKNGVPYIICSKFNTHDEIQKILLRVQFVRKNDVPCKNYFNSILHSEFVRNCMITGWQELVVNLG